MPYAITIDVEAVAGHACDTQALERAATVTLERTNQPDGSSVAITLVSDSAIQRLNEQYRGVESATDVLSFATREGDGFILPDDERREMGDVVISYETAARQASVMGHGVQDELTLLVIHGCLHLAGMDHDSAEAEEAMWRLQDELLAELGCALRSYSPPDLTGISGDGG